LAGRASLVRHSEIFLLFDLVQVRRGQKENHPWRTGFRLLRLNTSSCSRRSQILASREVRPYTDRSASRIRINNASIARCSTRPAPLRHADDVLNRRTRHKAMIDRAEVFRGPFANDSYSEFRITRSRSLRHEAAIHRHRQARHVRCVIRAQPRDCLADFRGLAETPQRAATRETLLGLGPLAEQPIHHRSTNGTWAYGVDADAMLAVFDRGCARQSRDAMLRRHVGRHPADSGQSRARRRIDDRAALALLEHLRELGLHAQPNAGQVDRQDAVPVVALALVSEAASALDARVVERAVELSVGRDRFRERRFDILGLRNIALGDGRSRRSGG
jgi:hypothetical protein